MNTFLKAEWKVASLHTAANLDQNLKKNLDQNLFEQPYFGKGSKAVF